MDSNLIVNASITIRDRCGFTHFTNADGDIEFSLGSVRPAITLVFDLPALRHFFEQAGDALGDLAVSIAREERKRASQDSGQGAAASSHLLPSDTAWAEDKILLADLSHLNTEVGRYILRLLDVDADRADPVSTTYEDDFGQRLITAGERLQYRAAQREARANEKHQVIEGEPVPESVALEHAPDRADGP
jgi:hypothetical protein